MYQIKIYSVQVHSHTSAPYASGQRDSGRCEGLWEKHAEQRNQHEEAGWSYSQPIIRSVSFLFTP